MVKEIFNSAVSARCLPKIQSHFTYEWHNHPFYIFRVYKFSHDNLIGFRGCSYVYRGHLKDGRTVAVKRLKASKGLASDRIL